MVHPICSSTADSSSTHVGELLPLDLDGVVDGNANAEDVVLHYLRRFQRLDHSKCAAPCPK